jgi:fatty-acyl-CoA synthase
LWGVVVAAVVALDPSRDGAAPPSADELSAWVGTRLAGYKRPRRVAVVDEVRRNSIGKADYAWARALLG